MFVAILRPYRASAFWTCCKTFSAELFHKRAGRGQTGKTPPKIDLAFSNNSPSLSRLNFSQPVKVHHVAAEFDTQFISRDEKLDDVRISTLVCDCLPAMWLAHHITPAR